MVLKNLITGQPWRNRHREQTYGHGERGGRGEIYGESNMETYITIFKIDSQREFAVWLRKLKQGLCINTKIRLIIFFIAEDGEDQFSSVAQSCSTLCDP